MPRTFVADLRINAILKRQTFLLRQKNVTTTRAGGTILQTVLADRTGTIPAVYFDPPSSLADTLTVGQGVEVAGRVAEFRDQLQITIERIVPVQLTELQAFLPQARRPLDEMRRELEDCIASIRQPDLARLVTALLGRDDILAAFVQAPAAKRNHHACLGGLLEHTLSVVKLVEVACSLYPDVDRDLAVTVALLHDLGKIRSYDPLSFELTEEGALWSHLYIGASLVEHAIDELPDFHAELRLRVVHAILAHHGKMEYGSPVLPMTLEAIILHHADHLDGDARGALDQFERSQFGDLGFTERSSMHDTRLYRGGDLPGGELED